MQVNIPGVKIDRVTKNSDVDVPTLFSTTAHLSGELAKIHSDLPNVERNEHKYIILSGTEYKKLKRVKIVVKEPVHPGKFKTKEATKTGKYQKELMEYHLPEQVNRASIEYIKKSFQDIDILYNIYDNDSVINNTLYNTIQHLWSVILDHEKQREINKIE